MVAMWRGRWIVIMNDNGQIILENMDFSISVDSINNMYGLSHEQ